jgi:predicted TPR repeat methyltransferase
VTPEQTGKAYDSITHRWTREGFNRLNGVAAYKKALTFLPDTLVTHNAAALDIGCGCTNRFIPIIEEAGLNYEGIDISTEMLKIARSAFPKHTFYHDDICTFSLPKTYAFFSAWDSFWHLPLDEHAPVLKKLVSNLPSEGVLLFSCGGVDDSGSHTNCAMGPEVYYASMGINGYISLLIEEGCFIRHIEYDQYPEQHTIVIAQKR